MTKTIKNSAAIPSILICWIFYLYGYIVKVEPSVLADELMTEFGMTSSIFGLVVSIVYIPYVILQIPCGIIADKLGTKVVVSISAAICSLGVFIFGLASSIIQLEIGRFLIGLATAAAFLCCGKIAADFFDKRKYAMLMGVAMCMGGIGGVAGSAPTAFLIASLGWRNATFAIAILGVVITIAAVFLMRNSTKSPTKSDPKLLEGLKIISKNPRAWLLGFYGATTYLPLSALAELWVVPFMERRFDVTTEMATAASIVLFISFGFGSAITAWIAEKVNSCKKTIIVSSFCVIFSFWLALYNDSIDFYTCLFLLFIGGTCAGANTLCFTIGYYIVPEKFCGTSAGFINTLIMASGILFQPLLGKLLDFFRNGLVTADGAPIYNLTAYRSAFLCVIVAMLTGIVATFFIDDVKYDKKK
ncbi:MAG: MFS transporter [Holosporales bacterium]|jgi:MFS family permease|nr:MFS transporter [Holosporales bacterium]